jgi:UDP-3-O-[3-hydroxymyristoyl] N-acetylglucosamine deacetylase
MSWDDGKGGSVRLEPSPETRYAVTLEYPNHPYIGTQKAEFALTQYVVDVAPARTFGFLKEIDYLRSHGLALGASYDNALVLDEDGYANDRRFENEMARHKILDLVGDLALLGRPIVGSVVGVKPGHQLNTRVAIALTGMLRDV